MRNLAWAAVGLVFDAHLLAYRATHGVVGHKFPGTPPMLLLDHVGARSGRKRTSPLGYIRDGDAYVVVASKGGDPRNPSWFHNLRAHLDTTIQAGSRRLDVRARVATPEEREGLWPRVVDAYGGYAGYQNRTSRVIALVLLEPR